MNPAINFQHPNQIKAVMKHLAGQEELTAALINGRPPKEKVQRASCTVVEIARLLGCSRRAIDKVVRAYKEGGLEAVGRLSWGNSGRPLKFHGYSQNEMDAIVSKETLKN